MITRCNIFLVIPLLAVFLMPIRTHAFVTEAAWAALTATQASSNLFVPTVSPTQDVKNVGIKFWGLTFPPLDQIAIDIAKFAIEKIVDSTINWINTGADGGPIYVTDSQQYFKQLGDGYAGEFIQKVVGAGNLCAPFQAQIVLSLKHYYAPTYTPQCTFTGIQNNLENFYNHFSEGGWQGWLSMTQDNANNPYGSYMDAKILLDTNLQNKLDLAGKKLDWSSGFKSKGDCLKTNHWPPNELLIQYENGEISNYPAPYNDTDYYSEAYPDGACLKYGPDKTPGVVIKDTLNKVLPSGFDQLVNAKQFDDLVSSLMSTVLQKYVFGSKGLFTTSPGKVSGGGTTVGGGTASTQSPVTCGVSVQKATVGIDSVNWIANSTFGGATTYSWSGDEIPNGSEGLNVSVVYKTPGTKKASVTATNIGVDAEGNPDPSTQKTVTATCSSSVLVAQYQPLNVSCSVGVAHAQKGENVTWTATISGGSGEFLLQNTISALDGINVNVPVLWDGDEASYPKTDIAMYPRINANQVISKNGNVITSKIIRSYTDDKKIPGAKSAKVTIIDKDPMVDPVVGKACDNSVYITN